MRTRTLRTAVAVVLVGLTLQLTGGAATAGDAILRPASSGRPAVPSTTRARVKIVDFAFRPRTLTVAKGTKVKWVNKGSVDHTTTSNKGLWDSGSIAPGGTFSRLFKKAGTFRYHCTIHPTMKGKIVVG